MKTYITILLILIFSFCAVGQTKKSIRKVPAKKVSAFLTLPFDSNLDSLPANFLGHNAAQLLINVSNFAVEILKGCGEFEKRDACQSRMNKLYERPIAPKLNVTDTLAFSVPIKCEYFADEEHFRCRSSLFSKSYIWLQTQLEDRNYMGENAFGVKKLIHYKKFRNIEIKIDKERPDFLVENIPPEKAQLIMPNLRMLIVGTLLQPFAKNQSFSYPPTLDNPEYIEGLNLSLIVEAVEIWLYDSGNGQVLEKHKFGV